MEFKEIFRSPKKEPKSRPRIGFSVKVPLMLTMVKLDELGYGTRRSNGILADLFRGRLGENPSQILSYYRKHLTEVKELLDEFGIEVTAKE
jgi:hypothetical protein